MKNRIILSILVLGLVLVWSCESTDPDASSEIESTILSLLSGDDSTFSVEGMDNADDVDYLLGRSVGDGSIADDQITVDVFDSLYVWRFGRSEMNKDREITVDVQGDTAAEALILYTITGIFHVKQFERIWTSDTTWEHGDSIRFSEKPIAMTVTRRVQFEYFDPPGGNSHGPRHDREHWRVSAFTAAYGITATSPIDLVRMEWIVGDSIRVLEDFENEFFQVPVDLEFATMGINQVNAFVTSDVTGENESVIGKWHHHPRMHGEHVRHLNRFHYQGTNDSGEKLYSQFIPTPDFPGRRLASMVEVTDFRTLFDHDYLQYDAVSVGLAYWLRRHVDRP